MTGLMRTFRRRKRGKVSPESVARHCWRTMWAWNVAKGAEGASELIQDRINAYVSATKKWQSVAKGCRAALLGNVTGL